MRRRKFIALLAGATAWPLTARAQQADRVRRIGVLIGYTEDDPETKARLAAFRQRLEKRGWKAPEGRDPKLLGVDGKMQLDLTDPDGTRVEFMEFKPVKDPCCSAYTGAQPSPASGW